jgi:hypothetical protein
METRLFGRSGHQSSVAIFGAAAFWSIDQAEADAVMELILSHGNHRRCTLNGKAEERAVRGCACASASSWAKTTGAAEKEHLPDAPFLGGSKGSF